MFYFKISLGYENFIILIYKFLGLKAIIILKRIFAKTSITFSKFKQKPHSNTISIVTFRR